MEKRLQKVNGDTVLDITEQTPQVQKVRLSENRLQARKAGLEASIARFTEQLQDTITKLALIENEKGNARK